VPADLVVGIDAGTSGARCIVARPGEGVVAAARRDWSYEQLAGSPFGWSFDTETFWSVIAEVTRAALGSISSDEIAAAAVTSQRLGAVMIDDNGGALYAGPNIDARAFAQGLSIDAKLAERVYQSSGKLPSLLLAPAKVQWLRAQGAEPAAVFSIADWVAFKLTRERRSERSLACDNGLVSVATCEYDTKLMRELDVPENVLPPLVSSTDVIGGISEDRAQEIGVPKGTPVAIAGADTQCALLAMGVDQPGEVGIVAGWSCPVHEVTVEPRFDSKRRTWACLHVLPGLRVVESSAADAGRAWRWWCETLLGEGDDAVQRAEQLAAGAQPGAGGVLALLGPRAMNAGSMGPHAGGVVMTTPVGAAGHAELLRAGLENIAFALRANVEQAQAVSGMPARRIALGGGFTKTSFFAQMMADVLERPIDVAKDVEVSARGAALLAARAVGLPEDGLRIVSRTVEPGPDVETYRGAYERWRKTAEALDATMRAPS
jgi:autoinducer 2 (AI-2) kinase